MSNVSDNELQFERHARLDFRIWFAFAVGFCLSGVTLFDLLGGALFETTETPLWMVLILCAAGSGMAMLAGVCLIANTSRGCSIDMDTKELIWWQMKFPGSGLQDKYRIKLADIGSIKIDESSDGVQIGLYDVNGVKRDIFGETFLPSDYNVWFENLAKAWPHIQIERV